MQQVESRWVSKNERHFTLCVFLHCFYFFPGPLGSRVDSPAISSPVCILVSSSCLIQENNLHPLLLQSTETHCYLYSLKFVKKSQSKHWKWHNLFLTDPLIYLKHKPHKITHMCKNSVTFFECSTWMWIFIKPLGKYAF